MLKKLLTKIKFASNVSNRFKTVDNKAKPRQIINNYLDNHLSECAAIEKIFKFANKHFIVISTSVEEYERKEIKVSRILWASLYRLCSLVTALRFSMSSVFHNRTMIGIMSDGHYLLSSDRILSIFVSIHCFVILFIGLLLQVNEMNNKWYLLTFFYQWKYHQLIPLNTNNKKRLVISINLMTKLLMKQAFWSIVMIASLLFCGAPIVAYFDNKYDFTIPSIVFFNICAIVWLVQFYCIVCSGFVAWSLPFFYLRLKFREIYETIEICVKHHNIDVLKRVISQHNRLATQTKLVDDVFRFVVFIIYYVASPALMLMIYLSHAKDTALLSRSIYILIVSVPFFVVFYLNLVCSQISHSSVKPRVLMFKFLIEHKIKIQDRIKLMQFIEKLSGPDIGFHCWNLFPMNNYTFHQYVANCALTYLLILSLIYKI